MDSHAHTSDMLVFHEPAYPQQCSATMLHQLVPGTFEMVDAQHLASRLQSGCKLLISFHGPYFPKTAWNAVLRFLEGGGNIAIFGGMPFAHPVNDDGVVEPEQDAYTRQIHLGAFYKIAAQVTELRLEPHEDAALLRDCPMHLSSEDAGTFWSFYPMLTQASDHPEDLGSAGPLDTVLQPLIVACAMTSSGEQQIATPALLLDQRSGRFKGGRWLISAWQPASQEVWLRNAPAIRRLLLCAAEEVITFDVRPALACYQPGEAPSLLITVRTAVAMQAHIVIHQPGGTSVVHTCDIAFPASLFQQEQQIVLVPQVRPGLYEAEVEYQSTEGQLFALKSGFWIWDESMVEATSHQRLVAGQDHFYQGEQIFSVCGTTYMDSRVQRKFLHLPNPARWDNDLAAMKSAGINLVRTGIWSAWREYVPVAGFVNEAFLRALDAFVMTFCKHNLQLIFTFFTFFPPLFEGENPWLDARSVEAQQDFVGLLARRYARVELLSWDLINEPSFGDPQKIFALRPLPHYDRFEVAAFQQWLVQRYTLTELQLRWRQTPADIPDWAHVLLPRESDYDTYIRATETRAMLKVADYTRFSQDMFNRWSSQMYEAIRAAGSQTLIGVGQDEAGARIAPQFYAPVVDYTTTHPWWNIDNLLWDMLVDKSPTTPNLIQETGVMLGRDVDMRPWRSEQENADLLERKLFTGLIARSAGVIQWLWHTNSYMTSENENSIGLLRSDGSAKPEMVAMREFGRLTLALSGRVLAESSTPDVWVVIPYSQWFVRPELARHATQQAIRILGYNLGIIPQMVGENQLAALSEAYQRPRAVIVPSLQLFDPHAWHILLQYVHEGGTLLVSGIVGRDMHNLPFAPGLDEMSAELVPVPVVRYEELQDDAGHSYRLTFAHEKISYVKKAHNHIYCFQHGAGEIIWCGLPLELADEPAVIAALYRQAINHPAEEHYTSSPLLICRRAIKDGTLILAVSEASYTQRVLLDEGLEITIDANRAGALILDADRTVQAFGGVHC